MDLRNLFFGAILIAGASTTGCVVGSQRTPVRANGYVGVQTPGMLTVQGYPPAPRFEQMSQSPGYGHVWVDGFWHWNNFQWVWMNGRWEYPRNNFVYISPYYDFVGGNYVYVRGHWSSRNNVPRGYTQFDRRGQRPYTYRRPVRSYNQNVHGQRGYRPPAGPARNSRYGSPNSGGATTRQPAGPAARPGTYGRPNTGRVTAPAGPSRPGNYNGTNNGSTSRPAGPTRYTRPAAVRPSSPGVSPTRRPSSAPSRPSTGAVRPQQTRPSAVRVPSRAPARSAGPTRQTVPTRRQQPPRKQATPRRQDTVNRGNLNRPVERKD